MRLVAAIAFAAAVPVLAQYPSPGEAPPAASAKAAPVPAKLSDVAWLQGYWVGEGLGGAIEDVWLPPKKGVMLGAFRLVKADGSRGFYELFAIEEVEGTLEFVVKHFNPDWVGWEEKDKALRIRLSRLSENAFAFGRIAFERTAADALAVRLGLRMKDGTTREEILTYRRVPL